MFKKIEIRILYLVVLACIPVTISFGILVRQEFEGEIKLGNISKTSLFLAEIPKNIKDAFWDINNVDLQVEDRFPSIVSFNGSPNLNESNLLLSKYDGDLEEGIVELIKKKKKSFR